MTRGAAALLLLVIGAGPAGARTRALIVTSPAPPDLAVATARIHAMLNRRGLDVDVVETLPADLGAYCCAWDLRFESPMTNAELLVYLAYVQEGHGVVFLGENPTCCRDRNSSIDTFLRNRAGAGGVFLADPEEILGTSVETVEPSHPISRDPHPVSEVTWDGFGAGVFRSIGSGLRLTTRPDLVRSVAAVWDEGTMVVAPGGRVVVVADFNWLVETFALTDNALFLENIASFACPAPDAVIAVSIATAPGFDLECPTPLAVTGTVDGSDPLCLQATRFGAELAAVEPDPVALEDAGPFAMPLLADRITEIAVSVNGSPFAPVASTAPTLPAPPPVAFTAIVAMPPGPATVTVRARDERGREADAAIAGRSRDSLPPVIAAASCQDETIDLDGACAATWAGGIVAIDACDPSVSVVSSPSLPIAFAAPGSIAISYQASDDSGNRATCSRQVTARDATGPVLACAAPVTVECSTPGGTPAADPAIAAWLATTTASDNCGGATLVHDAPATFPSACATGQATTVTWTAEDASGNRSTCAAELRVADTTPPTVAAPAPLRLECSAPGGVPGSDPQVLAWIAAAAAADTCGGASLADDAPPLFPSGCGTGRTTAVRFTATDDCALTASATSTLTVRDSTAPTLVVPAPLVLECDAPGGIAAADPRIQAWLAAASASDVCDGATVANDAPARFASGCGGGFTTTVRFVASDGCGNATTMSSSVTVRDTTPPTVAAPAPLQLECNAPGGVPRSDPQVLAWIAAAAAADTCGGASLADDAPPLFPSGCGAGRTTAVRFTATDGCGLTASATSTLAVRDSTAPTLVVPAPLVLECDAPGGIPASDPRIQAWLAAATAHDLCDGATLSHDAPAFFPSGCGAGHTTTVRFTAVDNCGNVAALASSITIADTTPPALVSDTLDGACLWPPNHDFHCIEDLATEIAAADACDPTPPEVRLLACSSSQPEDGRGDGDFAPDCVPLSGGRGVCLRSERMGGDPAGRRYTLRIAVTDACGNTTEHRARVDVPHDRAPAVECRRPNRGKKLR